MDGEEGTGVEKWAKKKLQFIALVSFFSFLFPYYSGFSSYNLQVSTLIFSLFAHAIDRKYVFLICNGILALLVNNFTFFGFIKSAEDGAKQIREDIPAFSVEDNVAYDISPVAGEDETEHQNEYGYGGGDQDMKAAEDGLEVEEEEDEEEEEVTENTTVEEVNDGIVSTEELNQKFEEFIRKMKEEIRVEAQQQLVTV